MEKFPFDAAQDGDTAAEKVVNDYICYLGETITNFVNIFRPDIVLLSGGICNQGKKLTEPLETYIQDKCFWRQQGVYSGSCMCGSWK